MGGDSIALPAAELSEYHTLAEVAKRVPKGIVCLLTALRFHAIGTQHPRGVWLTVERRSGVPRIDFVSVRIVRLSGAALTAGVDERIVEGVTVRVTNPARTVVDCFKFRNKIGVDVAVEALRDYRQRRKGTVEELWRQADRLRMTRVMRPYWDAIAS